jgi:hypothetical protein
MDNISRMIIGMDTCMAQLPSLSVLESETMESSPLLRAGGRGCRVTRI